MHPIGRSSASFRSLALALTMAIIGLVAVPQLGHAAPGDKLPEAKQTRSEPESFSGPTEQRARKASGPGAKRSHSGLWRAFATTTGRLWA